MTRVGILSRSCLLNIWNGIGRHTISLASCLSMNFDVTLLVQSDTENSYVTQNGQLSIINVGTSIGKKKTSIDNLPQWMAALEKEMSNCSFDFLICMNSDTWIAAKNYVAHNPSCKIIGMVPYLYSRAHWLEPNTRKLMCDIEKDYFASVDSLVCHTELLAYSVAALSNRDVFIIPNCTVIDPVTSLRSDIVKHRICYVGLLNKGKFVEPLLRAIASVPYDVELVMTYPEASKEYASKLKKLTQSLNISDRVDMMGWRNTRVVKDLYQTSSLTVVTGLNESYAYGVLDPLSLGTRVIASGFSGLQDYLVSPKNVYNNLDELLNLISEKLTDDEQTVANERIDGVCKMQSFFSPNRISQMMGDLLR